MASKLNVAKTQIENGNDEMVDILRDYSVLIKPSLDKQYHENLAFRSNHAYKKDEPIIEGDQIWYALKAFSKATFDSNDWYRMQQDSEKPQFVKTIDTLPFPIKRDDNSALVKGDTCFLATPVKGNGTDVEPELVQGMYVTDGTTFTLQYKTDLIIDNSVINHMFTDTDYLAGQPAYVNNTLYVRKTKGKTPGNIQLAELDANWIEMGTPKSLISLDADNAIVEATGDKRLYVPIPKLSPNIALVPTRTGSAGNSPEYSRANHQHPYQDVSADADNAIIKGSDEMHYVAVAKLSDNQAKTAKKMIDSSSVVDDIADFDVTHDYMIASKKYVDDKIKGKPLGIDMTVENDLTLTDTKLYINTGNGDGLTRLTISVGSTQTNIAAPKAGGNLNMIQDSDLDRIRVHVNGIVIPHTRYNKLGAEEMYVNIKSVVQGNFLPKGTEIYVTRF